MFTALKLSFIPFLALLHVLSLVFGKATSSWHLYLPG